MTHFPLAFYEREVGYTDKAVYYCHQSKALENALSNRSRRISVFNYSTSYQMVSDGYFYLKFRILKKGNLPILLIGLVPRDFYDPNFPTPMRTSNLRTSAEISDLASGLLDMNPSPGEILNLIYSRVVFAYAYRTATLQLILSVVQRLQGPLGLKDLLRAERFSFGHCAYRPQNNFCEVSQMSLQFRYLKNLVELSRLHGTKVFLLNMPIRDQPLNFDGQARYREFRRKLSRFARENNCSFLDLGDSFEREDFRDAVHLNAKGGGKFIEFIKPELRLLLGTER
ncbi:MAG: SGNH/GDSL hydrolase family protein [Candidatus Obscuribacterales bacterium]|nr:SGNH/GDSL hydrolase family protein [Candidatus Obscuribacterales bacterium]